MQLAIVYCGFSDRWYERARDVDDIIDRFGGEE
jgi:hypothetical protein